jgi:predicted transcriptional regulator
MNSALMLLEATSTTSTTLTRHDKKKRNTQKFHEKVLKRVIHLYDVERKRPDDVYKQVAEEFCLTERTVKNIFRNT